MQKLSLGLFRQPKYGHLKELHAAIKSCSTTLLQGVQRNFSLGELQEVSNVKFSFCNRFIFTWCNSIILIRRHLFHFDPQGYVFEEENGGCVALLINNDKGNNVTIQFRNSSYDLLPKSISILPDCQNVAFNTANVSYNFFSESIICVNWFLCFVLVVLIIGRIYR